MVITDQVRAELRWAPDGVAPGKQVWVGFRSRTSRSGTPTEKRYDSVCPRCWTGSRRGHHRWQHRLG
jgi:hypothetical protein